MTLNGVISPNSVDFGADYVKVAEDTPTVSATEMQAKNLGFSDKSFIAILAGNHPQQER